MLAHTFDTLGPVTIFVISGDYELSYAFSILRLRAHKVVVVAPKESSASLKLAADICFEWERDIMTRCRMQLPLTPRRSPKLRPVKSGREVEVAFSSKSLSTRPQTAAGPAVVPEDQRIPPVSSVTPVLSTFDAGDLKTQKQGIDPSKDTSNLLDRLRYAIFPWVLYEDETSTERPSFSQGQKPMAEDQNNSPVSGDGISVPSDSSVLSGISNIISQAMSQGTSPSTNRHVDEDSSLVSESGDDRTSFAQTDPMDADLASSNNVGPAPSSEASVLFSAPSAEITCSVNAVPTPPDSTPSGAIDVEGTGLVHKPQTLPGTSVTTIAPSTEITCTVNTLPTPPDSTLSGAIDIECTGLVHQPQTLPGTSVTTIAPPAEITCTVNALATPPDSTPSGAIDIEGTELVDQSQTLPGASVTTVVPAPPSVATVNAIPVLPRLSPSPELTKHAPPKTSSPPAPSSNVAPKLPQCKATPKLSRPMLPVAKTPSSSPAPTAAPAATPNASRLPEKFKPLAQALDAARRRGEGFRTFEQVEAAVWNDTSVRPAAGTESFKTYVQTAVQAGIVIVVFGQLALAKAWHGKV
ncbi:hypothetical protein NEOLEDRAFT_1129569 [Neolentinus lepideus HHB14362 ss-1]|uniref:NYN domain-containing protein n=1 Tax=Neolentinus lepideus HHB14362 ss-1 TaxID=1314782 RepID=A0A165UIQ2_9AGAM|nr:hypothetical protein NEOLEDRAFT_1129569 [Neolentinus lepideus HHB14362 ss-1]